MYNTYLDNKAAVIIVIKGYTWIVKEHLGLVPGKKYNADHM